jgi:hypothetical protein
MSWSGLLDFSKIDRNMISGLTETQIQEVIDDYDSPSFDDYTFLDDLLNVELSPPINPSTSSRFAAPLSNNEIVELNNSVMSKNTIKRNKWCLKLFEEWQSLRSQSSVNLCEMNNEDLNVNVSSFIHEVRKKNKERYPAASLVSIVAGLQCNINRTTNRNVDFFKGDQFTFITQSLDAAMKISTKDGAGLNRKSAEVISQYDEDKLWQKVLGDSTPEKLLDTLFYLNGLHFALRGGEEHCSLHINQFQISERSGKKCIIYKECVSKNFKGGLKNIRHTPKEVVHFQNDDVPSKCHVRLFEKFLKHRPRDTTRFYLMPAKKISSGVWYTKRPIGKNSLSKFVSRMCTNAGVDGNKRNHSLRATCATRLYEAEMDEQLIMERTGHRSVAGVRCYKQTSDVLISKCSGVLDSTEIQKCISNKSANSEKSVNVNFNFASGCNVQILNFNHQPPNL